MARTETYSGYERRIRDRSAGITPRRRPLELHLDQAKTRRAMIALLESWLHEAEHSVTAADQNYLRAVEHAIEVMTAAPDPLTAIAVLQRSIA